MIIVITEWRIFTRFLFIVTFELFSRAQGHHRSLSNASNASQPETVDDVKKIPGLMDYVMLEKC